MSIMNLFGLEGSSFIISLGLILLVAGIIMFYCLRRFNLLETSIIEQGRILQTFIMRMQERENSTSLATDTAINSALNQTNSQEKNNITSKIEVSDDEYETESNTDSENSESSESIINNDQQHIDIDLNSNKIEVNDEKNIEITTSPINLETVMAGTVENFEGVKIVALEEYTLENTNADIVDIESDSSLSDTDSNSVQNNLLNTLLPKEMETLEKKQPISKLKVADLRNLAHENGLVTSMEQAKKISKDELIKLLNA